VARPEEHTKDAAAWLASLVGVEVRHVLTKNGVDGMTAFNSGAASQVAVEEILKQQLPPSR